MGIQALVFIEQQKDRCTILHSSFAGELHPSFAPSKDPSFTSFEASAIKFPIPLGVVKAPRLPAFTALQLSQPRAKSIAAYTLVVQTSRNAIRGVHSG